MNILKDTERAHLLKLLEGAADTTLLNAVSEMNQMRDHVRKMAAELMTLKERLGRADPVPEPVAMKSLEELEAEEPATVPKIEVPPGDACTRVGSDTKNSILGFVGREPASAEDINKHLKRGPASLNDTLSVLKLLWVRGDLKYVGGKYQ